MDKESNKAVTSMVIGINLGRIFGVTPKECVSQREGPNGQVFDYVDPGYVVQKLNETFGTTWEFDCELQSPPEMIKAGHIIVKGKIGIYDAALGRTFWRSQYGSAQLKMTKDEPRRVVGEVGDSVKGAATDSLRKAASLWGLALDVYTLGKYGNSK